MSVANPVLAQKLGLTADVPDEDALPELEGPSPKRQLRRALGRAADTAVGLSAALLNFTEEELEAEKLIETGPENWVVIGLRDAGSVGLTGLFLLDPALRSALVEQQTMGHLLPASKDERKVTRTDAVLAQHFAKQLLAEMDVAGFGDGVLPSAGYEMGPMDDLRAAGLVMMQGLYCTWRVTIQLGGGDRQGEILIATRHKVEATRKQPKTQSNWTASLRGALEEAPADLDAVLTRMPLTVQKVEEFEVGQVLHLAGTTVGSVMLMGPDGKMAANARLGQVAGKRAVRIQQSADELQEAPTLMSPAAPPNVTPMPDPDPPLLNTIPDATDI